MTRHLKKKVHGEVNFLVLKLLSVHQCTSHYNFYRHAVQFVQAIVGLDSDTISSTVMSVRCEKPFTVLSVIIVVVKPFSLETVS